MKTKKPFTALSAIPVVIVAFVLGLYFAWPTTADAAWGNFWGALTVAVGALFGVVGEYGGSKNARAFGWAAVVVGGAAIAGAALKATA